MTDNRQYAPATQRNREVILETLLQILPPQGTVLEIASGTGEHSVYLFCPTFTSSPVDTIRPQPKRDRQYYRLAKAPSIGQSPLPPTD